MKRSAARWLDLRIAAPGPHLALCLSEAEFFAACRHIKVPPGDWISTPQADATAHTFRMGGRLTIIVCLRDTTERTPVEVAGLLVHAAVHAWQHYAAYIGEESPGDEQEACAIQSIAQVLMAEYARRMGVPC